MALHALPGGQSIIFSPSPLLSITSSITETPEASPSFKIPVTTFIFSLWPIFISPFLWGTSVIAPYLQTRLHPPQLWQISGKSLGFFIKTRALNLQKSTHSLQPTHLSPSNSGCITIESKTLSLSDFKNKSPFGASTSQSR